MRYTKRNLLILLAVLTLSTLFFGLRATRKRALNKQLSNAIKYQSVYKVGTLLDKGADPDGIALKIPGGGTHLHEAAWYGRGANGAKILRLLVARGASVNAKNRAGNTPLFWPIFKSDAQTIAALAESGADVNVVFDFYGASERPLDVENRMMAKFRATKAKPQYAADAQKIIEVLKRHGAVASR